MKALLLTLPLLIDGSPRLEGPLAAAAQAARVARQEYDLARTNVHYYVLDVPQKTLRLKLRSVELRAYPLKSIELGTPLWGAADPDWMEKIYELEPRPLPERVEIEPPPEGSAPAPQPETSLDEGAPIFTMGAGRHLSLRITSDTAGWRSYIADRLAGQPQRGAVRLRLVLSEEEARALHRSWPMKSKLLIIPAVQ
jgi:hypothetical protein